jgi:uncharacterized protein (DUF1800 family)/5-hydroxyisourate hydrolase-like protein (transthyretin family)
MPAPARELEEMMNTPLGCRFESLLIRRPVTLPTLAFLAVWLMPIAAFGAMLPFGNLTVSLLNGLNNQPIAHEEVFLQRRSGGVFSTVKTGFTDVRGLAGFEIDDLGSGAVYRVRVRPYNGPWIDSANITTPREIVIRAGRLPVTATAGDGSGPLRNTQVQLRELKADGSIVSFQSGLTDASGQIVFDPPGLGSGKRYLLFAQSPHDGSWKQSSTISGQGPVAFVVGNQPLVVTLANGLSGAPLSGKQITASRLLPDGSREWAGSRTTDAMGVAEFDLDGLGAGTDYVLRAEPYNGGGVFSRVIDSPGAFRFEVGRLPVTVVAGDGSGPMPDTRVELRTVEPDGSTLWLKSADTNVNGRVVFDSARLGDGSRFVLRAQSPHDGSWKHSEEIAAPGAMTFTLGSPPLRVRLVNGLSGEPLSAQDVVAMKPAPDGSRAWIRQRATDAAGWVTFDLEELATPNGIVLRSEPYNGGFVFSSPITEPGTFTFSVGELPVTLLAGDGSGPMAGVSVELKELAADGSLSHVKTATSDSNGRVVFDAPGLGSGSSFVVRARSPHDGAWRQSEAITAKGAFEFTVGNEPLRVALINHFNGVPLANKAVTAFRVADNGELTSVRTQTTDSAGNAVFDLAGLGSGTNYLLRAEPYNGGRVETEIITAPGDFSFKVGSVPVRLIDAASGSDLPGRELFALEKRADGTLVWRKRGTTNASGRVQFDLEGVSADRVYVIRAVNPLGNGETYHSDLIISKGGVNFRIDPLANEALDRVVPEIRLRSPADGTRVANAGFTIDGFVSDNQTVTGVRVVIDDPDKGVQQGMADLNPDSGYWSFDVPGSMLTAWRDLGVRIVAVDDSYNEGTLDIGYRVINDTRDPTVVVNSHADGDTVLNSGFVVSGIVSDNTPASVVARLVDSNLGVTIDDHELDVATDGSWDLVVRSSEVSPDANLTLTLAATDAAGNVASTTLNLVSLDDSLFAERLLSRATFGATPDLLSELQAIGPDAYLMAQLDPLTVDDSDLEARLADAALDPAKHGDFYRSQVLHAMHSRRQLLEVMTWFWENHFNTDLSITGLNKELPENASFREHALGYFRDLMQVSATSPAMLRYLDNYVSHKDAPNENYARELLELHTLGQDGGYTQRDVEEVARVFTGWRIQDNAFIFKTGAHDYGSKTVLGQAIAPTGYAEGEQVLDILAEHPSTARFICTKLLQKFVSDRPGETEISDCAAEFTASSGHIATVLEHIFTSPAFNDPGNDSVKAKTPQEYVVGALRALDAHEGINDHHYTIANMGMPLFRNPVPTGWPETAEHWSDSNQVLLRQQFAINLANRAPNANTSYLEPMALLAGLGVSTAEGIVGKLFMIMLGNDYSETEWQTALGVLTDDGTRPFDIHADDAEARVRELLVLLMTYPGFQLQ